MATPQRQPTASLKPRARASAELNAFFQLVRGLEREARARANVEGRGFNLLGDDGYPRQEALRFKSANHLAFPGSSVESLKPVALTSSKGEEIQRQELKVNFMGLTGPSGVLPHHYTRLVMERSKQRDSALADFLDLFNHRLVSLFYRSWVKYRLTAQYETYRLKNQADPITQVVKSLAGLYGSHDHNPQLFYSGHFARRNKTATSLQHMLADFLSMPVSVKSFVGQWLRLQDRDRAVAGSAGFGRNHQLGQGVLLGKRLWDVQSKIEITIGRISFHAYESLVNNRERFGALQRLITAYVPVQLTVDLKFVIEDELANSRRLGGGMQLSRNAWLQRPARSRASMAEQLAERKTNVPRNRDGQGSGAMASKGEVRSLVAVLTVDRNN